MFQTAWGYMCFKGYAGHGSDCLGLHVPQGSMKNEHVSFNMGGDFGFCLVQQQ